MVNYPATHSGHGRSKGWLRGRRKRGSNTYGFLLQLLGFLAFEVCSRCHPLWRSQGRMRSEWNLRWRCRGLWLRSGYFQ
uniref:Uncharacterized protein n=1 Tax=Physcomitrium patens TaxID=3218 RepID=A0A2K1J908_PHYPA|nr:hypothetical protein PHYPA_021126 [Physcomitrium patens]